MRESIDNFRMSTPVQYDFALGDELRGERATLGKTLLDVQRDLRIRAAYIDAIENARAEVFPNPAFVAGYVRSYARYLHLDADEVYRRFCAESGFRGVNGEARAEGPSAKAGPRKAAEAAGQPGGFRPNFPMAAVKSGGLPDLPVSAVGSLLVLVALVCGLGYGGWTVLQNIQRVEFAPVDELPIAAAELDGLAAPAIGAAPAEAPIPELASPVAATALVELYRAQEAEVPILVPRDGPIAAIDPNRIGLLARPAGETAGPTVQAAVPAADIGPHPPVVVAAAPLSGAVGEEPGVAAEAVLPAIAPERPQLTVFAERPAWVRVYLANGTVIFERILESGEVYAVPDEDPPAKIWAGNSGSVYVRIDKAVHGPIGTGTQAVKDVVLSAPAIAERYGQADDVSGAVSETVSRAVQQAGADPSLLQ